MGMEMKVEQTALDGLLTIAPTWFSDERGFFYESYSSRRFAEHGIDLTFVQDNHSRSGPRVVRGLHYQDATAPQHRLVRCTVGEIFDVVVDLRADGPTFGRWLGFRLSAENRTQLLIPPAFAHGFAVVSDAAEVQYKCTGLHSPTAERGLAWDDPELGIEWPVRDPVLSAKDRNGPRFADYRRDPSFR